MSGKLDQSLDDILKTNRAAKRRGGRRVKPTKTTATVASAPAGGVKKPTKATKNAKVIPGSGPGPKESKIQVSGLPLDVTEGQIKEYFQKTIGPIKRVVITYNQHGTSRGIALIVFAERDAAAKAAKLDGTLVDKRPMKIEVLMTASAVPTPAGPKSLSDRVAYAPHNRRNLPKPLTEGSANPKAQPKSAVDKKTKDKQGRRTKKPRTARPKPKSAEELDQEMADYFGDGGNATTATANGVTAEAATNGGGGEAMDEISVGSSSPVFVT